MAKKTAEELKLLFSTGKKPTGEQFSDFIDSTYGNETPLNNTLESDSEEEAATAAVAKKLNGKISQSQRNNTLASIGDSITWRNKVKKYNSGDFATNTGWLHWANSSLGQALVEYGNFAESGKRTDEMLAEQLQKVLDLKPLPTYCTVLGGANDIIQNKTAEQIIGNLENIYKKLSESGIVVIACTITPQTGINEAQKAIIYKVNRWLKSVAFVNKGFVLVDWFCKMSDSEGNPLTGVLADNVHQSATGAAIMGSVFAESLNKFVPYIDVMPMPGDTSNLQQNPFKTLGGNGYFGSTQSADVCLGYRFATADSTTLDAEPSIVERDDCVSGSFQRLKINSGNARLTNAAIVAASGNQKWRAVAELFISDEVAKSTTRISLVLSESGGSKSSYFLDRDMDVEDGEGSPLKILPGRMVLRTPVLTTSSATTGLFVHLRIFGGTGNGYIDVGRQSVERVEF